MAADDDADSNESDAGLGSAGDNGPVGNHDDRERGGEPADDDRADEAADVDGVDDADGEPDDTGNDPGDEPLDEDGTDEPELVGAGVRAGSGSAEEESDTSATKRARQKKDRATPRQRGGQEKSQRTTPASFVRGSVGELRKVVYPTRQQLGNYFVVVLVFVMLVIAIVSALDYGFGAIIVRVF